MEHIGQYDPTYNPIIPGGLSDDDRKQLENSGWKRGITSIEIKNVIVTFKNSDLPGTVMLEKTDIPTETEYYHHPRDHRIIFTKSGGSGDFVNGGSGGSGCPFCV